MPKQVKLHKHLYQCENFAEQKAWVLAALKGGATLSDSGLWLGGIDPEKVIAALRRDGVSIMTTKKKVRDAADQVHNDLAWVLEPTPQTAASFAG